VLTSPFVLIWGAMALVTAALIVWRTKLGFNEDDSVHLSEAQVSAEKGQIVRSRSIDSVDKWGKAMTALTVAYGVVLLAVFVLRELY
jgi:hypothetical protein